jgi:hypothetical protein
VAPVTRENPENLTQTGGCELDVEGASDKPRRGRDRERISEKLQKFPSDIMVWHGGGQSAKNECL